MTLRLTEEAQTVDKDQTVAIEVEKLRTGYGKIVVLEGTLLYRILEPEVEEILLSPNRCGVVEPTVRHEVVPSTEVRFYVEFHSEKVA